MSSTSRVRFSLLPKDYALLAALAKKADLELGEFCRQLAEVRAASEREKACPRCSGEPIKSRSWTRSNLGQA